MATITLVLAAQADHVGEAVEKQESLTYPYKEKWRGVRSSDLGGQRSSAWSDTAGLGWN